LYQIIRLERVGIIFTSIHKIVVSPISLLAFFQRVFPPFPVRITYFPFELIDRSIRQIILREKSTGLLPAEMLMKMDTTKRPIVINDENELINIDKKFLILSNHLLE